MVDENGGASRTVLLSLFWALQGSLLSWCYLQLKGGTSTTIAMELARDVLVKCKTRAQRTPRPLLFSRAHCPTMADQAPAGSPTVTVLFLSSYFAEQM